MLDRQKSVPAGISLNMQDVTYKEKEKVTESLANKINNLIDIKSKLSSISDHQGRHCPTLAGMARVETPVVLPIR